MGYDEDRESDCLGDSDYRRLECEFEAALKKVSEGRDRRAAPDLSWAIGCFFEFGLMLSTHTSNGRREMAVKTLARLIIKHLLVEGMPPAVQSLSLTALARWQHDASEDRKSITGAKVSWFGPVVSLVSDHVVTKEGEGDGEGVELLVGAEACVRWFCDMGFGLSVDNEGRPDKNGCQVMQPQSIRMLRGLLYNTRPDASGMQRFWTLAAGRKFPGRIFTQPGDHESCVCYLVDHHVQRLASLFDRAPEGAVRRFATTLARQVLRMHSIVYGQVCLSGGMLEQGSACDWDRERDGLTVLFPGVNAVALGRIEELTDSKGYNPDLVIRKLRVPPGKRPLVLKAIIHRMENGGRRRLVAEIFHL